MNLRHFGQGTKNGKSQLNEIMISFHIAYCVNASVTTLEACCSEFNQSGDQACVMGCAVITESAGC